jgi:hypothetical protein
MWAKKVPTLHASHPAQALLTHVVYKLKEGNDDLLQTPPTSVFLIVHLDGDLYILIRIDVLY